MASQPIYQFYAELEGYRPKIWRRFQVQGSCTIARLGYIVMTLYEMKASHLLAIEHTYTLHFPDDAFEEITHRYVIPDEEGEWEDKGDADATRYKLTQTSINVNSHVIIKNSRVTVLYDFGDGWEVNLKLEKVFNDPDLPGKELPRVLEGGGFGIIEDCGGPGGLEELAAAFKAKQGKEYENFCEWLGVDELDLERFDLDDMNFRLKKLPRIFADIYENFNYPTQRSIDLIERKYLRKS